MNLEVEAFVGELRQLREREIKLAKVVGLVENLMERHLQDSDELSIEDTTALMTLGRAVQEPAIQNWIDHFRRIGIVDQKRYPTSLASRQAGTMKVEEGEEDDHES